MIPQLDLHGIRHEDVGRQCDKFMSSMWGNYDCVDIVTGNSDNMRKMVVAALEHYDVEISMSMSNPAVLRVYL